MECGGRPDRYTAPERASARLTPGGAAAPADAGLDI